MWEKPPLNFHLNINDVHVWLLDLNLALYQVDELRQIISKDEQIRANKFHFKEHQERFIITRASLRILLGKYLQIKPQEIDFYYSEKGKPFLSKTLNHQDILFNLSHSENIALYGFTKNIKIGIDVEKIKDNCQVENLAKRFFTNYEYHIISNLKGLEQKQAFFKAWTSKEAYLKAIGEGLGGGLDKIEIELKGVNQKVINIRENQEIINNWCLQNIDINKDYIAAIALENCKNTSRLRYFSKIFN